MPEPSPLPREGATLIDSLVRAARSSHGVRFLSRHRELFYSYDQIEKRSRRLAGSLKHIGVEPGDHVAILLPTSIDFYDALFGALLAAAVPVPISPPTRLGPLEREGQRIASLLGSCGARLVLTSSPARR